MTAASLPIPALPRSYLFVPGDRPERFDKAWDSQADAVILDLEDAVAPSGKARARAAVAAWLHAARPVWLRCNAVDTPWFDDDLALLTRPGVAGLMLPKAERLPDRLLAGLQATGAGLIPLLETAHGMAAARRLARQPSVHRLAFGSLDFQVELGVDGEEALAPYRAWLVLASRLGGKPAPIDGVTPSLDDMERLRRDCDRARQAGMGARLCIHPRQVAVVHEVFAPDAAARHWAERVLAAITASDGGAVAVDGKMVDRPVARRAQAIAAAPSATQRLRD